ncbi:MAG: metallophosphoesterase family protein [Lachnospiraceae bacterium]|nr:metallophosphoesterase family protein [Lachnospiraceae bacterium]
MKYYISDLHFFHAKLNHAMDNRGFADVDEMTEYMIKKWNDKVNDNDEVIIIGDFSMSGRLKTAEVLARLKGRKAIIRGNHDGYLDKKDFAHELFEWEADYKEIVDGDRIVILCHYPVMFYNGMYHMNREGVSKTYMLYGHVHDTEDEYMMNQFIRIIRSKERLWRDGEVRNFPCQMINCFCMFSDYEPLSLDEWIEVDKKRRALEKYC